MSIFEDWFGLSRDDILSNLDPGDILGGQANAQAQKFLQDRLTNLGTQYQAYRPAAARGRMNALDNQLAMTGPVNDLLTRMYGPAAGFDISKLARMPMGQEMFDAGGPGTPSSGSGSSQEGSGGLGFDPLGTIRDAWGDLGLDASPTGVGGALTGASAGAIPGGLLGDPIAGAVVGGVLGNQYAEAIDDPFQSTQAKPLAAGVPGSEYARQPGSPQIPGEPTVPKKTGQHTRIPYWGSGR